MGLHLGAMDKAPLIGDVGMIQQPLNRARAIGGLHLVDLGQLLGQMHVDGSA